mgnify:CR=1 FL=1
MNAKLINISPLLTNPSSQKCAFCGLSHVYKSLNHRINHSNFELSRDVEKNPDLGTVIDSVFLLHILKVITALCGLNGGRQCVAMSLRALIHKHNNSISSSADLARIINIGNELYSVLSRLFNQNFLLLTELPQMITVLESNTRWNIAEITLVVYMIPHLLLISSTACR